jgi:hypothetical protein
MMIKLQLKKHLRKAPTLLIILLIALAITMDQNVKYHDKYKEVVFLSPTVQYREIIADEISKDAIVVYLSGDTRGVEQITRYLSGEHDIDVLRIISHGADGQILLPGEIIDANYLSQHGEILKKWGNALSKDADILLYGCRIAASPRGKALAAHLAQLSGADVAASINLTGGTENDWALEFQTGHIDAKAIDVPNYDAYLDTYTITSNADNGAGTLRQAISDANNGDDIVFNLAAGNETIVLSSGDLYIDKGVTINGDNLAGSGNNVIVDGNNISRGFYINTGDNPFILENMTIQNGMANTNIGSYFDGGGIYVENSSDVLIDKCTISGSTAGRYGGGIMVYYTTAVISRSTISSNAVTGYNGGGVCDYYSDLTIISSTITGNTSADRGGGVYSYYNYNYAPLKIISSTIVGNNSMDEDDSDGISIQDGTVYLLNSIVINNPDGNGIDINTSVGNTYAYYSWYKNVKPVGGVSTQATAPNLTAAYTPGDLGPLANNGGNTETMAASIGSPLDKTGTPAYLGADGDYYFYDNVSPNPGSHKLTNWSQAGSAAIDSVGGQRGYKRHNPPTMGAYEIYGLITWTGSQTTNWNTAGNWDRELVPVIPDDVNIPTGKPRYPIINNTATAECKDLSLENGGSLTMESGASLITYGDITNNGTCALKRTISEDAWHLVSIPVNGALAGIFLGDYLQSWNESTGLWSEIIPPGTPLNTKQGYLLWGTPEKATTYTFTGTPLTGQQSIPVTASGSGDHAGMNLLGNPYPSSIDWGKLDDNYGAIYYWDSQSQQYVSWNNGNGTNGGQQFIPPIQGFFIYAPSASDFTIGNSARTHQNASSFYKGGKDKLSNGLRLESDNKDGLTDETLLIFKNNAQEGFELKTDAWKITSGTDGMPEIYSMCNNNKLAIDVRPDTETVQLGFANNQNGVYSISLKEIADIPNAFIEDTKTGVFHNLQLGAYEFAWDINDEETRFKLHFNAVGIDENPSPKSNIRVYSGNKQIYIKGADKGLVRVCDLTGRVLLEQEISGNGQTTIPVDLKTGIYLVALQIGDKVLTEKVFIK